MAGRGLGGGMGLAKRRTAGEWRRLIGVWKQDGTTAEEFARAHGLCTNTLRWWSWELQRRARGSEGERSSLRFVELMPSQVKVDLPAPMPAALSISGSGVEVVLAGRRAVVRVVPGFDAATLQRVVLALEAQPC